MGFVNDAEISQIYRDARIGPIFEGTNYIQAQDLLGRKVLRDQARVLSALLTEIETTAATLSTDKTLALLASGLHDGCTRLRTATKELMARWQSQPDLVGSTAYHFLHWVGTLAGGWQLARMARSGARGSAELAAFYGAHVLPRVFVHDAALRHGLETITKVAPADV
jgi:acyl-CoA dehydrogenase